MKVAFDYQIFSFQKYGGVSKYFCEMISCLPKDAWEIILKFSNNEYLAHKNLIQYQHFFNKLSFKGQNKVMSELNKIYALYRIPKITFDIFHPTNFNTYYLSKIRNKPVVTTFHDINVLRDIGNSRLAEIQKRSIERSDKIIAVSNNTKKDIMELLNLSPSKIEVIYHGVDKPLPPWCIGEKIVDRDYILFVGRREESFKNFNKFAYVFSNIIKKKPFQDLMLVCTGTPFTFDEIKMFKDLKIEKNVLLISANENQMANLYTYANCFIFPSSYEGFGMPILEAMSYSCPCVISNTSSFPEIAQDAATYFDPMDIDDMYEKIILIIDNNSIRKHNIKRGLEISAELTWNLCAEKHMEVYKSLI